LPGKPLVLTSQVQFPRSVAILPGRFITGVAHSAYVAAMELRKRLPSTQLMPPAIRMRQMAKEDTRGGNRPGITGFGFSCGIRCKLTNGSHQSGDREVTSVTIPTNGRPQRGGATEVGFTFGCYHRMLPVGNTTRYSMS